MLARPPPTPELGPPSDLDATSWPCRRLSPSRKAFDHLLGALSTVADSDVDASDVDAAHIRYYVLTTMTRLPVVREDSGLAPNMTA